MQTESMTAAAALADYFTEGTYGHAANLVLEPLPNGELAWLKPCDGPAEDDEARYWPTEAGRQLTARWRAEVALYGREIS